MESVFMPAPEALADEVFALIAERIAWMDEVGIRQWNEADYTKIYPREYYREKCREGKVYVLMRGEKVLCAAVLLEEDGRWNDREAACYVHNFAASVSEKGAGGRFLACAERLARLRGKKYMRLDCAVGNEALNRYYEERGYRLAGSCAEGGYRGNRREKRL